MPQSTDRLQFREVRQLALELLARHGLFDWSFTFNWRKRTMGLCLYHVRRIELSVHFVERNGRTEIVDTILHEIAHALVGPEHGHGATWKQKCIEIGARPERCGNVPMPEGRWQAGCNNCGQQFQRHRRPKHSKRWYCMKCGPDAGKLVWREHVTR